MDSSSTGWRAAPNHMVTPPTVGPRCIILPLRETAKLSTLTPQSTLLSKQTQTKRGGAIVGLTTLVVQTEYLKGITRFQVAGSFHYITAVPKVFFWRDAPPGPDLYLAPLSSNARIRLSQ